MSDMISFVQTIINKMYTIIINGKSIIYDEDGILHGKTLPTVYKHTYTGVNIYCWSYAEHTFTLVMLPLAASLNCMYKKQSITLPYGKITEDVILRMVVSSVITNGIVSI